MGDPAGAGLGGGWVQGGHAECESPVNPLREDVKGQLDPESGARGGPGWRQGCRQLSGGRWGSSPRSRQGHPGKVGVGEERRPRRGVGGTRAAGEQQAQVRGQNTHSIHPAWARAGGWGLTANGHSASSGRMRMFWNQW